VNEKFLIQVVGPFDSIMEGYNYLITTPHWEDFDFYFYWWYEDGYRIPEHTITDILPKR
jgi:hypothetical protein